MSASDLRLLERSFDERSEATVETGNVVAKTASQVRSGNAQPWPDVRRVVSDAMALILAGGRGSRLKELTAHRSKPSLYFGGKYRIVDFALSNCVNSNLRRIAILTQYKSHGLLSHVQRGWGFLRSEVNEFVELWPAQQQIDEASWYKGTADAVRQNINLLRTRGPSYIVVLAGDHIYKMDYGQLLASHVAQRADVTVACVEVPRLQASQFGIVAIDSRDRIVDFIEKPAHPPSRPGRPDTSLASMGVYVFNAECLYDHLMRDARDPASAHDFGRDVITALVPRARVCAHHFGSSCVADGPGAMPYWRDVGTLDAYWEANMDLTRTEPALNLYDRQWPIFTHHEQLPPAKFVHDVEGRRGMALNSVVSDGCIVSGATVRGSVLSSRVRVNSYASLDGVVLSPDVEVGRHARLTRVIVDRDCKIPAGLVVGEDPEADGRRFTRSEGGVTLITPEMLARLGTEAA
jgi:glucose-1-phosphate adenylyltransferase